MRFKHMLAGLALGLAIASAPANAAEKLTVLLDWFVNPDHAAIVVAQQGGYFARAGLDVTLIEPADPSAPPRLVAAGQGDIALTYQPSLYEQVKEGLPLLRIGTAIATPLNCLVVLADGPVKSMADLKGRTIGYSIAGFEQALLATMLESAGLKLSDVHLVDINFALTPALAEARVDAVIGAFRNFEVTELQLAGKGARVFYPEDHGVPAYDELIYVAQKDHAATPATAQFLDAVEAATLFTLNHPAEAWGLFIQAYPKLDDALNRQAWTDTLPRLAASPRAVDLRRYARFGDYMKARGLIDVVEPVGRYVAQ